MKKKLIEMSELYDVYQGMLTEKQRDIFDHYYNNDLTLSEIADNEDITRQAVRDAVLRSEEILRDLERRLGLCEHFRNLYESVEAILLAASEIESLNRENYFDTRISKAAETIVRLAKGLTEESR